MMCISGPPCTPGNTVRSRSFAYCSRHSTMPPRGPRSVLCVVVVTKSACGTGLGCTPPATRPAMCAMSTISGAPTRLATAPMRAKSITRGIGAGAGDDHLGLVLLGELLELVVVDPLIVFADAVRHDRVELARKIQRVAVRQVAAVREVHAEHGVARLQQRQVDAHVGLRARMRLHVDVIGAEQRLGARDRQRLGHVDEFAAAVIALAGIALGVLVRHHRAGGFEHGGADEVFRRDQLESLFLPPSFRC